MEKNNRGRKERLLNDLKEGFYDRFLVKTNAKTIVPISKKLIIEKLPVETHDKKIDLAITD